MNPTVKKAAIASCTLLCFLFGPLRLLGAVNSVGGTTNEITTSPTTGSVVVSLPTSLTFTGKTVTGGTFTGVGIGGFSMFSGTSVTDTGLTAGRVTLAG